MQVHAITCFGVSGLAYEDNTLCPGSNACCGREATCLSNRLCHNPNDPEDTWVRGPCAIKGWDDSCGQICLYNETANRILPRVTECRDGSLCCNNDPQCCQDGRGVFLDESGNVAQRRATAATTSFPPFQGTGTRRTTMPVSTGSSTSFSTTNTATSATSSSTTTGVPAESSSSGESSAGLKVGLGLGIPLAVLITGILAWVFFRRRKNALAKDGDDMTEVTAHNYSGYNYTGFHEPPPYQHQQHGPVEIGGNVVRELDGRTVDSYKSPQGVRERHELG
ncbi:hypothetical protein QBC35DRAFT_382313 [Podospora australis]|uniref:Mid2 domain-containing protein n=1 Tax=Podospora australis TaxID=1536484 RepID=A0AAN7AJR0_9PEZI|nr:hypothetical protein QBC35DRAFT_382313 [Podospora australis]